MVTRSTVAPGVSSICIVVAHHANALMPVLLMALVTRAQDSVTASSLYKEGAVICV